MAPDLDWNDFVEEHYDGIYRYCFSIMRSKEDAEDAVQNAFLKAWKKRSALTKVSSAKAWMYSIARNTCIDKKRWWNRWKLSFTQADVEVPAGPQPESLSHTLKALINNLPHKQREVFILRHWHGFSTSEAAELLGIQPGTVKSHLKRAVDSLKKSIELSEAEMTTESETESSYNTEHGERI